MDSPTPSQHKPRWLLPIALGLLPCAGAALFLRLETRAPKTSAPKPPAPLAATSSSAQPKITWSQPSLAFTLSPGESASPDLTFSSSLDLTNVVVEAVPEIAGFVSFQPTGFAAVPAGQPELVHLSFAIPAGTPSGTYDGTIHLKVGGQTLPKTLKVILNVWSSLVAPELGVALKFPPGFATSGDPPRLGETYYISNSATAFTEAGFDVPLGCSIGFAVESNPGVGLTDWAQANVRQDGQDTPIVVGGRSGLRKAFLDDVTGDPAAMVLIANDNNVVVIGATGLACLTVLDEVLMTVSFF